MEENRLKFRCLIRRKERRDGFHGSHQFFIFYFPTKSIKLLKLCKFLTFCEITFISVDHLLISCPVSHFLWMYMLRLFGIDWVMPGSIADLFFC